MPKSRSDELEIKARVKQLEKQSGGMVRGASKFKDGQKYRYKTTKIY